MKKNKKTKTSKKNIFKVLKGKKKPKKEPTKTTPKKPIMSKIAYILATMRFKKNTIFFVRNLSKRLQSGKTLSKDQLKTLNQIYDEWIAGKPKTIKQSSSGKKVRVLAHGK